MEAVYIDLVSDSDDDKTVLMEETPTAHGSSNHGCSIIQCVGCLDLIPDNSSNSCICIHNLCRRCGCIICIPSKYHIPKVKVENSSDANNVNLNTIKRKNVENKTSSSNINNSVSSEEWHTIASLLKDKPEKSIASQSTLTSLFSSHDTVTPKKKRIIPTVITSFEHKLPMSSNITPGQERMQNVIDRMEKHYGNIELYNYEDDAYDYLGFNMNESLKEDDNLNIEETGPSNNICEEEYATFAQNDSDITINIHTSTLHEASTCDDIV